MVTVVNQPYSTSGNGGRKSVRLSNGWEVAVTKSLDYFRFYVDKQDGNGWTPLCYITHDSIDNNDATIASMGTKIYVIHGMGYAQFHARYIDATTVTNTNVSDSDFLEVGQYEIGKVSLTINPQGTELHAVWSSKNSTLNSAFNLRYIKGIINQSDGSVAWGTVEQVTVYPIGGQFNQSPSIILVDGEPIIIREYYITSYGIACMKKESGSWVNKPIYSNGSYIQSNPSSVADRNGVISIAWHGYDSTHPSTFYIRFSKSLDNGITWTPMQKLVQGKDASLTVDQNNKYIITYEDNGVIKQIESTDTGDTWSTPIVIGNGTNPNSYYDNTFTNSFASAPTIYQTGSSVEYVGSFNNIPTVEIKNNQGNIISESQQIRIPANKNFTIKLTADDVDVDDTLEYIIKINNVAVTPSMPMTKLQEYQHTFLSSDLILGQNSIDVIVKDDKGGEKVFNFKLNIDANLPIDSSCLANMKFNGYNKSTLSLAELVNHLE